jgi:acetyl esterase
MNSRRLVDRDPVAMVEQVSAPHGAKHPKGHCGHAPQTPFAKTHPLASRGLMMIVAFWLGLPARGTWAADIQPDRTVVYKRVGDIELSMSVFLPPGHQASDRRPAIVFFFGGGWAGGTPKQFYQQARAFADRGLVATAADYRVIGKHKITPFECVKDGKSAVRWLRAHAAEWGIDPQRIVAAGGSAGGHVAACTGVIVGQDEAGEDLSVSSVPDSMILYNPVIDTTEKGYGAARFAADQVTAISPCHHVHPGIVPTLVFHGTADTTVPYENAERFQRLMAEAGNRCDLIAFEGKKHGFFNGTFFRGGTSDEDFQATMDKSLVFLRSLGYLP